jgi:RNA polymerase sigma-70 factor (ECF subfamily)
MAKPSANDAFRRINDEHHAAVFAYCLRRAPIEDAKDAAAEVFLVAWRRLDDLPTERALPWLYGTARKVLANQRRGRSRSGNLTTKLKMNVPALTPTGAPETTVIRRERDQEIVEALERLREPDREVIRLSL